MVGALLVVLALLALVPVFLVLGGVMMAVAGQLLNDDAKRRHEGSELVDTNV